MRKLLILFCCFFITFAHADDRANVVANLVTDANSGYLLYKKNIHARMPPASLTKLMTLYLTFSALDKGWLKMDNALPISDWAASQEPSNLDLIAGDTITVREAILALIVKSANDVAVVLAESMAPTETFFAQMMTQAAQQLGMKETVFKNASGLHDPEQLTSAQDMAILALAIIRNFPHYYPLFASKEFTYHGREYKTHNHVLLDYEGAEGLKTGYISAVGYNIISTAKQNDTRLIGIVMGEQTARKRDDRVKALLDHGFTKARRQKKAIQKGLIQPAFDPLHRKAMIGNLNMDVFAPIMKGQTHQAALTGAQLFRYNQFQRIHDQATQITFTQTPDYDWSIQIGAFKTHEKALSVANKALALIDSKDCAIQTQHKSTNVYRSRLIGFKTRQLAQSACQTLHSQNYSCFVVAPQGDR